MKKIKHPLSRKIALMVIAFSLLLNLVAVAVSFFHYKREMHENYELFAMNIASVAAAHLNPDKFQYWLDSGEKDEEYLRAYQELCLIRENGGIEFLYVVKPEPDEVWYIMDTDPTEGAIPLGYHEPYYEGAFADNAEKMARGEKIEPLVSDEEFGWLMSVYYPLRTSAGEPAGYVGVDIRMNDVREDLYRFTLQMLWLLSLLTVLFAVVMIYASSRTVAIPIRKLSTAAERFVAAEESKTTNETDIFRQLTIRSNDEVGALHESLSKMEQDMNSYIRQLLTVTAKNERITAELSLANRIQASMLPHVFPPFPNRDDFDIYATMRPAKEVGGDFYDFFLVDEDHLCMVIADVTGKGVPAALYMMITKTILQSYAMLGKSAEEVFTITNEALCINNPEAMFVTAWLGILELSTGKLIAANAGHEYPAWTNADGSFELLKDKHSLALGCMNGIQYREYDLHLDTGAKLFVYTDGIPEATDSENAMFGTERMLEALNQNPSASPKEITNTVYTSVNGFVREAEQFDDMTMMCIEYKGKARLTTEIYREYDIDATDSNLEYLQYELDKVLEEAGCPDRVRWEISVAAEEIFINIAHYAYAPNHGNAKVAVKSTSSSATIVFEDSGVAYNPLEKADPDITLPATSRQIGGLGIYMTKKLMDQVTYERKKEKNILTLQKSWVK